MTERRVPLSTDETYDLIGSDKVEGTAVYNEEGEKLGTIHNFMVDKRTGKVEYAVLQFGGILGVGSDYYPLPWEALTYDVDQGGYVVALDKEIIKNAPHYADDEPRFDRDYGQRVYGAYGMTYPMA